MAGLFRLLQDQMGTLAMSAPTEENREFLRELVEALECQLPQEYIATWSSSLVQLADEHYSSRCVKSSHGNTRRLPTVPRRP
jgi:hypothetical protein